jgi:hypothetical protein
MTIAESCPILAADGSAAGALQTARDAPIPLPSRGGPIQPLNRPGDPA